MNTDWSTYVQGVGTLHLSRSLRFADIFRDKYREAFAIKKPGSILEIGCGTGALAKALHRWYPGAAITAMDRDTAFIEFARKQAPEITFQEADAARPPYADHTFDVTISNTVAVCALCFPPGGVFPCPPPAWPRNRISKRKFGSGWRTGARKWRKRWACASIP